LKTTNEIMDMVRTRYYPRDNIEIRAAINELQNEIKVRDRAHELSNVSCNDCIIRCTGALLCYESCLAYARKEIEASHD